MNCQIALKCYCRSSFSPIRTVVLERVTAPAEVGWWPSSMRYFLVVDVLVVFEKRVICFSFSITLGRCDVYRMQP